MRLLRLLLLLLLLPLPLTARQHRRRSQECRTAIARWKLHLRSMRRQSVDYQETRLCSGEDKSWRDTGLTGWVGVIVTVSQ